MLTVQYFMAIRVVTLLVFLRIRSVSRRKLRAIPAASGEFYSSIVR